MLTLPVRVVSIALEGVLGTILAGRQQFPFLGDASPLGQALAGELAPTG